MSDPAGRERSDDGRDETEAERLDRNYSELLQELRVAQTGVQILFAFLLGIAFQQRFTTIDHAQRVLYLITLTSAAAAAVLLIAPVAAHRVLFRRSRKDEVVAITSRLASAGLACLAVAILSAVVLVVDFVSSTTVALTITITLGVIVAVTWLVVPVVVRRRPED
jgi:amino acid transporter